jgi:putative SOS response-associated peptidase YedK
MHDRMPVILAPRDYERWLQRDDAASPPVDLLRPYDAEQMHAWRVDTAVGNVKNNSAALLDPVPPQTLF